MSYQHERQGQVAQRAGIARSGRDMSTGRAALRPTPDSKVITATPTTMLMMAVNILLASGAGWVNGAAATAASASPVIQAKNKNGRGAPILGGYHCGTSCPPRQRHLRLAVIGHSAHPQTG
jgi:hypothetical protein